MSLADKLATAFLISFGLFVMITEAYLILRNAYNKRGIVGVCKVVALCVAFMATMFGIYILL